MSNYIPGTTIPLAANMGVGQLDMIDTALIMSGGLTLSQVCQITGLNSSTIQNWVKRGWVESPKNKRYGETSLYRIMIINMLRGTMKLDSIVNLMAYLNGRVDDRSDDIIPDKELFTLLYKIIIGVESAETFDVKKIDKAILQELSGYEIPDRLSQEKLSNALRIMILAYIGTKIRQSADDLYGSLIGSAEQQAKSGQAGEQADNR